jgi:hypothetical protein
VKNALACLSITFLLGGCLPTPKSNKSPAGGGIGQSVGGVVIDVPKEIAVKDFNQYAHALESITGVSLNERDQEFASNNALHKQAPNAIFEKMKSQLPSGNKRTEMGPFTGIGQMRLANAFCAFYTDPFTHSTRLPNGYGRGDFKNYSFAPTPSRTAKVEQTIDKLVNHLWDNPDQNSQEVIDVKQTLREVYTDYNGLVTGTGATELQRLTSIACTVLLASASFGGI